ncbi:MAG: hypothetical protein WD036_02295 [Bauldia sp.]
MIDAYGALMERPPGYIMDVSVLPASKSMMKKAIKVQWTIEANKLLRGSADAQTHEKLAGLEVGYAYLAHFQVGVGEPWDVLPSLEKATAPDSTDDDMLAAMRPVGRYLPFSDAMVAEAAVLRAEFQAFREVFSERLSAGPAAR